MWRLIIPITLCLINGEAQRPRVNYPVIINNDRAKVASFHYTVPPRQYVNYAVVQPAFANSYPPQRASPYVNNPYNNGPNGRLRNTYSYYNNIQPYTLNGNNLRRAITQSQSKGTLFGSDRYLFDLDYDPSVSDSDVDPSTFLGGKSYFEDLELVENFGNYLKKRTSLDGSSTTINDAAHQYNAILAVLIGLARVIRNSCADFDEIYDQVYLTTVDTYYKHGLTNADRITSMIEEYIRKGNSHIPKLRKLKQEICEKDQFCSVSVDNKIKSSPLLYVKELETLDALAHLAQSFYQYIEEFNQAAQKGNVLYYLQNSKDRLREYVMHAVNSVEHLSDRAVKCT